MTRKIIVTLSGACVALLVVGVCAAQHAKKGVDLSKTAVVLPFESAVKGAAGLPEATRAAVIQTLKDDGVFAAVLTPEEAKDKDKATLVEISARLVDFAPGNAGKRLMVGFGSGRAHAGFEFTLKEPATGDTVWTKTIKQTASFWFNSTTSSAAERGELPDGVAKTLVKELKAER
jgi:hypothetical protein